MVRRRAHGWFREFGLLFVALGVAYPFAAAPFSIASASLAVAAALGLLVWRARDPADRIPGREWGAGLVWPALGAAVSLSAVLFLPPVGLRYGLVAVLLVAALVLAAYQLSKLPSREETGPPA